MSVHPSVFDPLQVSDLVFFELSLHFCITFEKFAVIFAPLAIQDAEKKDEACEEDQKCK